RPGDAPFSPRDRHGDGSLRGAVGRDRRGARRGKHAGARRLLHAVPLGGPPRRLGRAAARAIRGGGGAARAPADRAPRREQRRGAVLLGEDGRRCPIIGAVTMDLMMVDTGDRPARVGDVATLIGEGDGEGKRERISLEEFSAWSGELQRAVLTSLGPRLPRIYD